MQKILDSVRYITFASPLIGNYSIKLFTSSNIPENMLNNNGFSMEEFAYKHNNSQKIKFVWFSPNINASKGIGLFVPALAKYK